VDNTEREQSLQTEESSVFRLCSRTVLSTLTIILVVKFLAPRPQRKAAGKPTFKRGKI